MGTALGKVLGGAVAVYLSSATQLLDRNCWPDFSQHYGSCCTEGIETDPECFDEMSGRTFQRCCRCENSSSSTDPGLWDPLGFALSRAFFGPLLCEGPTARSRLQDFQVGPNQRPLRIYVYPLHRRFNGELLNRLQLGGWISGSECDYGLTPCTEERWNGLFSVYRQFATEVIVLMKFLAAPPGVLTRDPAEADLFVVPYLAKTDCAESGNGGRDPCWGRCKCATAVKHLFQDLPHYSWATRGRHLFLATGDIKDLPVEIQAQPLVISLGASFCGGHIVVPSPNLDPTLQPGGTAELKEAVGRAPRRHNFIYWFGSIDKEWRKEVMKQVEEYGKQSGARPVAVHDIRSDYASRDVWQTDASKPQIIIEEMLRSVFCPVVQGDVPHQKRLFDSVLTGCIPVVIAFPSHKTGEVSWWFPGGPPVSRMVPFPTEIDYYSFVVEVPQEEVAEGRFVEYLLRLSDADIRSRQEAMRRYRQFFRFDFTGSEADGFSLLMKEIGHFLGSLPGGDVVPAFDCGIPPWQSRGTQMYGLMACCPIDNQAPRQA